MSFFTFLRLLTTNCESWFMYVFTCRIHFAQFAREIRRDVSVPLSLGIVVTCLGLLCVCVKRKRKCCLLAVQLMKWWRRREEGGGSGGFGLSAIRSGMQWRPLNCALNPNDGAIDVVTWWRCGTCVDYITMYVCPKGGVGAKRREG